MATPDRAAAAQPARHALLMVQFVPRQFLAPHPAHRFALTDVPRVGEQVVLDQVSYAVDQVTWHPGQALVTVYLQNLP
jgi:hypothetical protein